VARLRARPEVKTMSFLMSASVLAVLCLAAPAAAENAATPPPASPQTASPQTDAERKKLEEEIARELGTSKPAPRPGAPAAGGRAAPGEQPTPAAPATGGNPVARVLLLPDISAIGSAAIAYDSYDVDALSPRGGPVSPEGEPRAMLEEIEVGIQAIVDPYVRADVFLGFSGEGVDIEEAYATTLALPASLQLRGGQFFSPFGRLNQQHPHVWEFVDAPLANGRLLADEALSGPGVEVGWLAPLPWFAEVRLAGQSTTPEEDGTDALTGVARLLQYFPLSGTTTLGVGLSAAMRDEGRGTFRDLGGVDVHLRWRPLDSRSYVALQGELYARRFRSDVLDDTTDTGGYGQAFWKTGPYLGYGVRYDWAPTDGVGEEGTERRYGAILAWVPSEFERIRFQVSYDRRPGGEDGWEGLVQLEFGVGAHGAHPF
jgi:hypothetical protein